MAKAIAMTPQTVAALPFIRAGKTRIIRDKDFPGFVCFVGKRTKSFALVTVRTDKAGKRKTDQYRCGDFELLTEAFGERAIDEAKRRAHERQAVMVVAPRDPDQFTLKHAWHELETDNKGSENEWAATTLAQYRLRFNYLKPLHDTPLTAIKHSMAKDLFRKVSKENGPTIANHAIRLASTIWNHHIGERDHDTHQLQPNPFAKTATNKEKPRHVDLNEKSLPAVFDSIMRQKSQNMRCLWMAVLFSGLRRANLEPIKRDHMDGRERGFLDFAHTKGQVPDFIPITNELRFVLDAAIKAGEKFDSDFVFPSEQSVAGHVTVPGTLDLPSGGLTKRGNPKLTSLHGMRHIFRQMISGASISGTHGRALMFHATGTDVHDNVYLAKWADRYQIAKSAQVVADHISSHLPKDWQKRLMQPVGVDRTALT